MGKEKSPAIRGGHWGGGPPESLVHLQALAAARGYRHVLPSTAQTT